MEGNSNPDGRARRVAAAVFALGLFVLSGANSGRAQTVQVAASFFPLAHFAEQVGRQLVLVTTVLPPGAEPHGWEPTPGAIRAIWDAKVFLFQGGGIDPWAERLRDELRAKGTHVLRVADHLSGAGDLGTGHSHAGGLTTEPAPEDPHIWMDPLFAAREVELIRDTLTRADPAHAADYSSNAERYIGEIMELDASFRHGLRDCTLSEIIVTHNAFGYLGRRYGFTVHAITGLTPEREPSPRALSDLAALARRREIRVVFREPLAPSGLAKTLAADVGAETLELDPLGTSSEDPSGRQRTYLDAMQENLRNLRRALKCR